MVGRAVTLSVVDVEIDTTVEAPDHGGRSTTLARAVYGEMRGVAVTFDGDSELGFDAVYSEFKH